MKTVHLGSMIFVNEYLPIGRSMPPDMPHQLDDRRHANAHQCTMHVCMDWMDERWTLTCT